MKSGSPISFPPSKALTAASSTLHLKLLATSYNTLDQIYLTLMPVSITTALSLQGLSVYTDSDK
eukprot:211344-Karenia_brevis.AAC.1